MYKVWQIRHPWTSLIHDDRRASYANPTVYVIFEKKARPGFYPAMTGTGFLSIRPSVLEPLTFGHAEAAVHGDFGLCFFAAKVFI